MKLSPLRMNVGTRVLGVVIGAVGCGDADAGSGPEPTVESGTEPLYAIQASVFSPDGSTTSYIVLSHSLDLDENVSLDDAREFPGRVKIAAAGGHLFVAEEATPRLERFAISDAFEWSRDEETLSFANEGVPSVTFDTLVRPDAAYGSLDDYGLGRVVWDPQGLSVVTATEDATVPREAGGVPLSWGSGLGFEFDTPPLWIYTYADEDYFDHGTSTYIATFDPDTHEESSVFELDCPALFTPSQDEEDRIYLSNWDYLPTRPLYGTGTPSCVRRLNADATWDEDWKPDFTEWTGGRQLMAWYYLEDGIAVGNVLHHELLEEEGADFSGEYDADVHDKIETGEYYRPWLFDLNAETARPMDEFPNILWGFGLTKLDGRAFVTLAYDDYTRTEVFEIDAQAGTSRKHFEVDAYIDGWVKVR